MSKYFMFFIAGQGGLFNYRVNRIVFKSVILLCLHMGTLAHTGFLPTIPHHFFMMILIKYKVYYEKNNNRFAFIMFVHEGVGR